MKHYHCINCGYTGEFKIYRQRDVKCESCDYDELSEITDEEWEKEGHKEKHERCKNDPFYKKRLKNG